MSDPHLVKAQDGRIWLELPGKTYKPRRCIGRIIGDTLHVYRNLTNKKFKAMEGLGFCYRLIKDYDDFSYGRIAIHIEPTGQVLLTTPGYIIEHGRILRFKRNDLEMQVLISLEALSRAEAHPDKWHPPVRLSNIERERRNQQSLFHTNS